MSTSWIINTTIGALLLPPLNMILLCAIGLIVRRRHPRLGVSLSVVALLLLTFMSTGGGAKMLARPLENESPALSKPREQHAQAIVILSGGRFSRAPEYGGRDLPGLTTLGRIRYGATLQRQTGLPVLVTGGAPDGAKDGEAVLMARSLQEDFGVPVKWIEPASDDTAQNAEFSARILQEAGIRRVLLVTDALHMPRSRRIFERNGFDVVPAPTDFHTTADLRAMEWVPSGPALGLAHYALHEWLGLLWYRIRH